MLQKLVAASLVAASLLAVPAASADSSEQLYVLKYWPDKNAKNENVLVKRTNSWEKDKEWIVEYGAGCSSMPLRTVKPYDPITADYKDWLQDGGGTLQLPKFDSKRPKQSCKILKARRNF